MKKVVFIGDPKHVKYVYFEQTSCTLLREAEFPFAEYDAYEGRLIVI